MFLCVICDLRIWRLEYDVAEPGLSEAATSTCPPFGTRQGRLRRRSEKKARRKAISDSLDLRGRTAANFLGGRGGKSPLARSSKIKKQLKPLRVFQLSGALPELAPVVNSTSCPPWTFGETLARDRDILAHIESWGLLQYQIMMKMLTLMTMTMTLMMMLTFMMMVTMMMESGVTPPRGRLKGPQWLGK